MDETTKFIIMILLQSFAGIILVVMIYHINETLEQNEKELRYSKRGRITVLIVSVSTILALCILSPVVGAGSDHPT